MKNRMNFLSCIKEQAKEFWEEYNIMSIVVFIILMGLLFGYQTEILLKTAVILWIAIKIIELTNFKKARKLFKPFRKPVAEEEELSCEEELIVSAGHEAGHALMCYLISDTCKVEKMTLIREGDYLAHVAFSNNAIVVRKQYYMEQMYILLAGMVAEIVLYGEHCNGCAKDLGEARLMACGMLNCAMGDRFAYSDDDSAKEVDVLLQEVKRKSITILSENKDVLLRLRDELLDKGILNHDEVLEIIEKED